MFSQACVKNSVHREGVCGKMGGFVVKGGMRGKGRACMAGGACVTGEIATAVDGTHSTGMYSCL